MTLKWAKTTKNYAKMGKQNVQKRQKWLKMSQTGQYVLKYAKLKNKIWKQWVKVTKIEQKWAKMTKKWINLSKNGETMGK